MSKLHASVLEVRDLRLVLAIATRGGVTRAASALSLTQSAVSHQLRALEERLGARLFERIGRGVRPTREGNALVQRALHILPAIAEAEAAVRAAPKPRVVRITTSCFTTYHWLPHVAAALPRHEPGVELRIAIDQTPRAFDALLEGAVDLALVGPSRRDRRVVTRAVFEDEVMLLVRDDHALAARRTVRTADLAGATLFVHDVPRDDARWFARRLGPLPVRSLQRVPLTETIVDLVRGGAGVALVNDVSVASHVGRGLRAVRMKPRIVRTMSIAWRRSSDLAPLAEIIAKRIEDWVAAR